MVSTLVDSNMAKASFWVWSVSGGSSHWGLGFGQRYHIDRHGQRTLKQSRLSVLNEQVLDYYIIMQAKCV
jgi:hypothetical protein